MEIFNVTTERETYFKRGQALAREAREIHYAFRDWSVFNLSLHWFQYVKKHGVTNIQAVYLEQGFEEEVRSWRNS